ncbi:hypothetical protein EYF80_025490 [Liparis tanakae]|uniref:Uncharacterized protein n=1 Tax=Liparis tanakae TaxID=230148 RepID=A0A4Z2HEH8_9TELE|nr:hypothetical protein EYF80_025490 [Liparis tanakae]
MATKEYANRVPMDIRSTRAARSNRKAIRAVRGHGNKPSPRGYAARLHCDPRAEAGGSPATTPDAMVARRGVLVRALILDSTRNSSPSSAMA